MKLNDEGHKGIDMDCHKVEDQDIIERYVTERLSEQETEAFEQHYLECPRCFGELKMRHAAAIELCDSPIQLGQVQKGWRPVSWNWVLASAAAAAVVVAGILFMRPQVQRVQPPAQQIAAVQQPSAAVLERLASIDQIPPYVPGQIRGGETNPAIIKFQEGMELYSKQKYSEAVMPLSEAARLDPRRPIVNFYLGISYLVSVHPDEAIEQFMKVTAQDNPYSEEGHWFLSKAYIKKGDFRSARTELQTVQSLNGAHAAMAQDLLKQIQNF